MEMSMRPKRLGPSMFVPQTFVRSGPTGRRGFGSPAEYGYSQEVYISTQAAPACPYPYWIELTRAGICEKLAGSCVVVTTCEALGYVNGDQSQCCGWECGAGSRCVGQSNPLPFNQGKCIAFKGILRSANGDAQVARYFSASLRITQGCGIGPIIYETSPLYTWSGAWGDFILSWTIEGALWNAVQGKGTLTAHLVIKSV